MSNQYPQLSSYVNRNTTPSLCICCSKTANECPWLNSGTPVKGWEAKETSLINAKRVTPSYKVNSCPLFKETVDYYGTEGDLMRLMSIRSEKGIFSIRQKRDLFIKAWKIYSKTVGKRSLELTEEERNKRFQAIFNKLDKKEKIKRKEEKRKNKLNK